MRLTLLLLMPIFNVDSSLSLKVDQNMFRYQFVHNNLAIKLYKDM